MKSTFFAAALAAFLLPAFAVADQISWDGTYDVASTSLDTVACSDGSHGLESKYHTFGGLPSFPYIGGAAAIGGWNSASCGTCWKLTYTSDSGNQTSINVLAIDHAEVGFNLSLEAMNALTNGLGGDAGIVQADVAQVDKSVCGL
ncbi:hypothetical protein PLICRDRAFT_41016 [Plicaturopsis crispa FD-325 SS-3]|nr:hypothetical protein PLICRDRAFT_41016 [Plicaturopsis crispa FD-325 SS-3]